MGNEARDQPEQVAMIKDEDLKDDIQETNEGRDIQNFDFPQDSKHSNQQPFPLQNRINHGSKPATLNLDLSSNLVSEQQHLSDGQGKRATMMTPITYESIVPSISPRQIDRVGSDNSFQFQNNILDTIGGHGASNGANRRRLDSAGSAYSTGSGSPAGGHRKIHFYDSDTSGGSVVFQKTGGHLSKHWRQPSDTSLLSSQSFDSEGDLGTFEDSTKNSKESKTQVNPLTLAKDGVNRTKIDHSASGPSIHLPYHERKMLRANFQQHEHYGTNLEIHNNDASPRSLHTKKLQKRSKTYQDFLENNTNPPLADRSSSKDVSTLPKFFNQNQIQNTSISRVSMHSKDPPQLNTITSAVQTRLNSAWSKALPSKKRAHGVGQGNSEIGHFPPPRVGSTDHRRRTSSLDSVSPEKETVKKSAQTTSTKLSRPPRLETQLRHGSTSSIQSTLTGGSRSRKDSQDSFRSSSSSKEKSNQSSNGNSAVLSSLSDQLARDVAHFFIGEKKMKGGEKQRSRNNNSGGSGFLNNMFAPISPTNEKKKTNKRSYSIEDVKTEYHQQNQEFLSKAKKTIAWKNNIYLSRNRSASPVPYNQMITNTQISSNYQNPSHRQLKSIDNDDWDDNHDDNGNEVEQQNLSPKGREEELGTHSDSRKYSDSTLASDMISFNSQKEKCSSLRHPSTREGYREHQPKKRAARDVSSKDKTVKASSKRNHYHTEEYEYELSEDQDLTFSSDNDLSSNLSASLDNSSTDSSEYFFDNRSENSSLLPPSGISSHEPYGSGKRRAPAREKERYAKKDRRRAKMEQESYDRERRYQEMEKFREEGNKEKLKEKKSQRRKKERIQYRKSQHRRRQRRKDISSQETTAFDLSSSSASFSSGPFKKNKKKRNLRNTQMLRKERDRLVALWKEEHRLEMEAIRKYEEENRWYNRCWRCILYITSPFHESARKFISTSHTFISNLPLTIGAIALAIVTLGVVWFKFVEENLDSCVPVHYRTSQCTFPEFPGCFLCDTEAKWYRYAVRFHYGCSMLAGTIAFSFVLKLILAFRVVVDEMTFPTTSSPAGLICMTMVCVFAGRGTIGKFFVISASCTHFLFSCWFLYMTLAFHLYPDPSWFPNTVGLGLSAVKTWLYYPGPGSALMVLSVILFVCFYPVSLIRVTCNKKISAPVCWIQMSAPAVSLYAMTIWAQPSFEAEHPDVTDFQKIHRMVYLPCMHFMFFLSIVGAISSVQSLFVRWDSLRKKEFSPAFAAFCFPTLAHANAVQSYRGAIDAFSTIKSGSWGKDLIYGYWLFVLVSGTFVTVVITAKFFYHLPGWVQVDVADEEEPPAPNETMVSNVLAAGETFRQNFVSPVILQANETGVLIRRQGGIEDGRGMFVRTRRVTALGFEPTMKWSEMNEERELLLDWVAKNPPRRRRHTLSVPGIDFNNYHLGEEFGRGNSGVYDPYKAQPRVRANTTGQETSV